MVKHGHLAGFCIFCFFLSTPAAAEELWAGVFTQKQESYSLNDPGVDVKAGWRSDRIDALSFLFKPSVQVVATANLDGGVNYATAGLSWRVGKAVYFRPGFGITVHDGPSGKIEGRRRKGDLGSRILFTSETAIGVSLSRQFAIEAGFVHSSHGELLSNYNPGINSWGVRMVYRMGKGAR